MSLFGNLLYYLDQYWDDIADKRVNHWPLLQGGIWRMMVIMAGFLLLIKKVLPDYMKNRKPFDLTRIMLVYNSFMVVLNMVAFSCAVRSLNFGKILLDFKYPSLEDRSPQTMYYLGLGWYFMLTRFLDLSDTFFMVLRKKDSQLTTLHVYHHTINPILSWVSLKYNAMIPIIRLFITLNTAVHTVMYGYYALSALGPSITQYLWWKRYITRIQILQFVICGIYGIVLYFKQTDYPMDWFYFCVGHDPIFLYMFYDFYRHSYNKNKINNKNNTDQFNNNKIKTKYNKIQ